MNPFQPQTDDPAEYWLWLSEFCAAAFKALPSGTSPQSIYWDHPDEQWKNKAQAREEEQENSPATEEFLRRYLSKPKVKLPNSAVLYCSRLRLEFAQRQTKLFATACGARGRCPLKIPDGSHLDNLMWLLNEVYRADRFRK